MGDRDKPNKLPDDAEGIAHFAEQQRLGHGHAVWVPNSGARGDDVMRKLLDDPTLAFTSDYSHGTQKRIEQNPQGIKKGYDPYDSGQLVKKDWKKKKDLRRLSEWIKTKKPKDE
jgi:hypothetical protein